SRSDGCVFLWQRGAPAIVAAAVAFDHRAETGFPIPAIKLLFPRTTYCSMTAPTGLQFSLKETLHGHATAAAVRPAASTAGAAEAPSGSEPIGAPYCPRHYPRDHRLLPGLVRV